jgi:hypothetical protein
VRYTFVDKAIGRLFTIDIATGVWTPSSELYVMVGMAIDFCFTDGKGTFRGHRYTHGHILSLGTLVGFTRL